MHQTYENYIANYNGSPGAWIKFQEIEVFPGGNSNSRRVPVLLELQTPRYMQFLCAQLIFVVAMLR